MDVDQGAGDPATGTEAGTEGDDDSSEGLDRRSEAALRRSRKASRLLDEAIRVPGTNFRVGADPILGILPVGGDAVAFVLSLYPIAEAVRLGLPRSAIVRMLLTVLVDAVVGSIPVIGPIFDAVWKANEWNVRLMERHLE